MQPVIPWYVAPVVIGMVVALAFWLYRLVSRAVDRAELSPETRTRVRRGAGFFLGGWLVLALVLAPSTPSVGPAGSGVVPLSIPIFGGISLTLAIGLLALSPAWRRVVDAIPADALISVQVYRLIGGIFLPLYAIGSLPRHFALPAAYGDLAVGLLAPFVALAVRRQIGGARPLALGWNVFGFVDLLAAVGLGTGYLLMMVQPELGTPPGAAAMTFFPLLLIPTYAVPLGFILHTYSIRRMWMSEQWKAVPGEHKGIGVTRATASSH